MSAKWGVFGCEVQNLEFGRTIYRQASRGNLVDVSDVQSNWLSADEWQHVTKVLPIACVDVLPIIRDESGLIVRIGLIWRSGPQEIGDVWCHIGGRLNFDERLLDGVGRHLQEVLVGLDPKKVAHSPFTVMEYFTTPHRGKGYDPRKHAVAACFLVDVDARDEVHVVAGSEALAFKWFHTNQIPKDVWPGTKIMIDDALELSAIPLTYAALSAREASRDQMMWQTPALAMTAMAFLLTIALGDSGPDWGRKMAAALSTVVAVISFQLMARHSGLTKKDADTLWDIEDKAGMRPIHQKPIRKRGVHRLPHSWVEAGEFVACQRSRDLWLAGLGVFAGTSFITLIVLFVG